MASSIGAHTFAVLQGQVQLPSNIIETIALPSHDYERYRVLGTKAPVFTLRSIVNVADLDAGYAEMLAYKGLKTEGLQTLVLNDTNYFTDPGFPVPLKVQVLEVNQDQLTNVLAWCGSLDDSDGAKLVATWSLQFKGA
jgi:hypothetical protein